MSGKTIENAAKIQFVNLVPNKRKGNFLGTTAYEVLLFDDKAEYDKCETEADFKKHIYAKFRAYYDAMVYAERLMAVELTAHMVMVRV